MKMDTIFKLMNALIALVFLSTAAKAQTATMLL